jgi:hypothetical protein
MSEQKNKPVVDWPEVLGGIVLVIMVLVCAFVDYHQRGW